MNWIKRCETCKWGRAKHNATKTWIQCHINPPVASSDDSTAWWPVMDDGDWCGKYETDDDERLACPVCGFTCTHVRRVYTRMGSDAAEAGVYNGTLANGTTASRRSALVIEVDGECGHAWEMILQQHKGDTFVTYQQIPVDDGSGD